MRATQLHSWLHHEGFNSPMWALCRQLAPNKARAVALAQLPLALHQFWRCAAA